VARGVFGLISKQLLLWCSFIIISSQWDGLQRCLPLESNKNEDFHRMCGEWCSNRLMLPCHNQRAADTMEKVYIKFDC
jgi:predicted Abi (CAAX) family protease